MSKLIDITGQKFNRLTVIKRVDNIGRHAAWLCECECGNQKIVRGDCLRNGSIRSCGCLAIESARNTLQLNGKNKITKDLVGQRFGHLIVLSLEKENNRSYWLCQCDCGNQYKGSTSELTQGKRTSCGCQSYKNITGKKFGKLTVLYPTDKRGADGSIIWHCQCECGNEIDVNGSNLRNGHTKTCGCSKSQGEEKIVKILTDNHIIFEQEKTFDDCKFSDTNAKARFDFYINNNYIIEFDGEQHIIAKNYFGGQQGLEKIQQRDNYKNQWCKEHNIPIIRIPYSHLQNICLEDLLLTTSSFILKE